MRVRKKRVFWGFFNFDYKAIETYLEEMAVKGWMLKKISTSGLFATFRAIEPQQLKFYIDVFKDGGALVPENHPDVEAYRRMCEDSGWNFVTSRYYYQIFAAAAQGSPTPIHTDIQLQQKLVETILWKRELIGILLTLILLIASSYMVYSAGYVSLLFFTGVASLIFPGLGIYMFILGLHVLTRMYKAKLKIVSGQAMEEPSLKSARRRVSALYIPVCVFVILFLASMLADLFFAPFNMGLLFLIMILPLGIGFFFRYLIKDKAKSKAQSKLYALTAVLVTVVVFYITASSLFSDILGSNSANPEGYQVITLEDLTGIQGVEVYRSFSIGRSPVVPRHYDYSEVRDVGGIREGLMIRAYQTIHPLFAGIIFDGIAEESRQALTSNNDLDLWNADRLMTTADMGTVLIQKDNLVLYLEGDLNFSSEQIRRNLHQLIN